MKSIFGEQTFYYGKIGKDIFILSFSPSLMTKYKRGFIQNCTINKYVFASHFVKLHHVTWYNKSQTESCRINQGTAQTYFNHFL